MPYHPVYVNKETRERVKKLSKEADFPHSAIVGLGVELLDEFSDDIEELRNMLKNYQHSALTKISPRSFSSVENTIAHISRDWTEDWEPVCVDDCPGCKQDTERGTK